jgi:hypothetical protein
MPEAPHPPPMPARRLAVQAAAACTAAVPGGETFRQHKGWHYKHDAWRVGGWGSLRRQAWRRSLQARIYSPAGEWKPTNETLLSASGESRAATSGMGEAAASRLTRQPLPKNGGAAVGLKGSPQAACCCSCVRHLLFSRSRRWLLRGLCQGNGRMPSAPISCLHQDRGERRHRWMMHWWRRAVASTRRASRVKALANSILFAARLVKALRVPSVLALLLPASERQGEQT